MCQTCDKLRAEIRELREELAEWERSGDVGGDAADIPIIAAALNLWPQPATLVYELLIRPNRLVTREFLVDRLGYGGMGRDLPCGNTDEGKWLSVVLWKARRALEAKGIFDAIHTAKGQGYMITRQKALEIRRVVGIDE